MAITQKKQLWFWGSPDGSVPTVREYPIAASQGVFMPGAICYISTSGTVKLGTSTSSANQAYHGVIVGLADPSATWPITSELSANTKVKVALFDPSHYWAIYASNGSSDVAVSQSMVGDNYGLVVSSTSGMIGYAAIDTTATSNVAVQVVDLATNLDSHTFGASDVPGVLIVRFVQANINATAS